jgi:photosystem II stability/assembly factor-like uncharacterized protein
MRRRRRPRKPAKITPVRESADRFHEETEARRRQLGGVPLTLDQFRDLERHVAKMATTPRDLPRPAEDLFARARTERAALARRGLEVLRLKPSKNPSPNASFGFASPAVTLAAHSTPAGLVDLVVPLDGPLAAGVMRHTVRLFRWDPDAARFRLVPMSAAGDPPDVAWGRVSESGTYVAIGIPTDPITRAALEVFRAMAPLEGTLKGRGAFAAFTERLCGLILCAPDISRLPVESFDGDVSVIPFPGPGAPPLTPRGPGHTRPRAARLGGAGQTICERCLGLPSWNLPELEIFPDVPPAGGQVPVPHPFPPARCAQWVNIGPANVTGVIRALAAHPTQPATLYAGALLGGVWRTIDGGQTWSPTMNSEEPSVYAVGLCRAKPDVLYAAPMSQPGVVYRSDDGGWSWSERAILVPFSAPTAIAVHPTDPFTVYVASTFGLYKTTNGGLSWVVRPCTVDGQSQANGTSAFDGNIDDVKLDPDAPNTVYMSVRTRGVFKSADGGLSWVRLGAGLTFNVLDDAGHTTPTGLTGQYRTLLAIGEDKRPGRHGTQFLVAKVQGTILTSPDGGATWRVLPDLDHGSAPYSNWTSCVAVCPADEDFIVAGGILLSYTLNASSANPAWDQPPNYLASFHYDQQAIAFPPTRADDFYYANDGMVALLAGRGASNTRVSQGLVATQCGRISVSQSSGLVAGCVTDHNGTLRTGRTNMSAWDTIDWPEGGLFAIDPTNDQVMFSQPQAGIFKRSNDGGLSWTDIGQTIDVGPGRRLDTRFMAIRPDDGSKLWLSASYGRLHYSLDGGTTWDFVKDAAGAPLLVDGTDGPDDGPFTFAFAPGNTRVLYVGTRHGRLWRTASAAVTSAGWQQLNTPYAGVALGQGFTIVASAVHPADPALVYIGYFNFNASFSPVWRGQVQPNGTVTWADRSGAFPTTSLPRIACRGLVIDPDNPDRLWATSAAGVFVTEDGGNWWRPFNEGLPRVSITGLSLRVRNRTLYLSTWGRGVFARAL